MPSSPVPPIPSSPPLLARPPSPHPGRPQRSLRGLGTQTPACPGGWLWATPSTQQVSTCPGPGPAGIEGLGERDQGHRLTFGRSPSPSARAAGAPHPRLTGPPSGLTGPSSWAHEASSGSQEPPGLTGPPLGSQRRWAHRPHKAHRPAHSLPARFQAQPLSTARRALSWITGCGGGGDAEAPAPEKAV